MSQPPESVSDTGEAGCIDAIDIVFVMDVSLSMAPFFAKLEQEIFVVDEALRRQAVTQPPHYGLAVFVDDALVVNAGQPFTDVMDLHAAFVEWRTFTGLNTQVNTPAFNLDWTENSLDGLYLAATQFQWRDASTTLRMIIHTTDDTFWDLAVSASGTDALAGPLSPISMHGYIETIEAIRTASVRVNHFAAPTRTFDNSGSDVAPGFFTPYMGAQTIPLSTGGVAWNINDVLNDVVSLAEDIETSVIDTQCEEYPPEIPPLE